ncbi:MAG: delta-60 repeat domain-containing protein [Gammaproteobacteria bacterium]
MAAGIRSVSNNGVFNTDIALARYNPDGSLDASFGAAGKVVIDLGGTSNSVSALVQPDGKLVAAGDRFLDPGFDLILVRYNADGSLDTSFGSGGLVVNPEGSEALGLVLQPDGKLMVKGVGSLFRFHGVAAGGLGTSTGQDRVLARYHPDGTLDTSFGTGGVVVTDGSSSSGGWLGLAVQADGRLVAGAEGRAVLAPMGAPIRASVAVAPCSF